MSLLDKFYNCFSNNEARISSGEMSEGVCLDTIKNKAENYYSSGDFYCSEAIVKTIKDELELDISESAVAMASGFPVGIGGAGCLCGALTGGVMILGAVFGRTKPGHKRVDKTMELSNELHGIFKEKHGCTCCRVLTKGMKLGSKKHMEQCVFFTGEMAVETVKIIARETDIELIG